MSGNTRDPGRSTLDRLFSLLDAFDGRDMTLSEIATRTGLPRSTAHRVLTSLTQWGGIERAPSGCYRIGVKFWELGATAHKPRNLRAVAHPFMQELHLACGENVQLAIEYHETALVIENVANARSVPTLTELGSQLPLHATGVGKVLLAFGPDELRAAQYQQRLRRYTPYTLVLPGRLASSLAQTRATGLGTTVEELSLGASSIAVPVFDTRGQAIAALGIVAHTNATMDRYAEKLRASSQRISRLLRDQERRDSGDDGSVHQLGSPKWRLSHPHWSSLNVSASEGKPVSMPVGTR